MGLKDHVCYQLKLGFYEEEEEEEKDDDDGDIGLLD